MKSNQTKAYQAQVPDTTQVGHSPCFMSILNGGSLCDHGKWSRDVKTHARSPVARTWRGTWASSCRIPRRLQTPLPGVRGSKALGLLGQSAIRALCDRAAYSSPFGDVKHHFLLANIRKDSFSGDPCPIPLIGDLHCLGQTLQIDKCRTLALYLRELHNLPNKWIPQSGGLLKLLWWFEHPVGMSKWPFEGQCTC